MVDVTDSKSVGGDTVWVRVPPPAPRRSSLRTARKRQAQKRLPFPHLCSVAPPSQIGSASLGSDLNIGKRASERMPAFWCRACGAVLSASLKLMGGGAAPPPKPFPKVSLVRKTKAASPCRACGAVLSASLKRERGLPSPLALFPCKLDTRFGFESPKCTKRREGLVPSFLLVIGSGLERER